MLRLVEDPGTRLKMVGGQRHVAACAGAVAA